MTTDPRPTMQHAGTATSDTDRLGMTILGDEECWQRLRDLHPVMDLVEHTSLDLRGRPIWLEGYRDRNWLRLAVDHVVGRRLESS